MPWWKSVGRPSPNQNADATVEIVFVDVVVSFAAKLLALQSSLSSLEFQIAFLASPRLFYKTPTREVLLCSSSKHEFFFAISADKNFINETFTE